MEIGLVFLVVFLVVGMVDGNGLWCREKGSPRNLVRLVNAAGMGNVYSNPIQCFDFPFLYPIQLM